MMRLTPIIKSEIEIKSRSLVLPILMLLVNSILFIIGLAGSSGIILSMQRNYTANYGAFLRVYFVVAAAEYVLVLFIAPLLTAGSVSGEIERKTFDLLMTTKLTPIDIILEKMASAFISIFMLIVSGLPALLVPILYGGVHFQSCIFLMLVIILESVLILSIGMFASCIGKTTVRSIAIAYACTAGVLIGPVLLAALAGTFAADGHNSAIYLLAIDPILPVLSIVLHQIGEGQILNELFLLLHAVPDPGFLKHAVLISVVLQIAISFGFVMLSIIYIMPHGITRLKKKTAVGKMSV